MEDFKPKLNSGPKPKLQQYYVHKYKKYNYKGAKKWYIIHLLEKFLLNGNKGETIEGLVNDDFYESLEHSTIFGYLYSERIWLEYDDEFYFYSSKIYQIRLDIIRFVREHYYDNWHDICMLHKQKLLLMFCEMNQNEYALSNAISTMYWNRINKNIEEINKKQCNKDFLNDDVKKRFNSTKTLIKTILLVLELPNILINKETRNSEKTLWETRLKLWESRMEVVDMIESACKHCTCNLN